jgi:hypothetical protein
MADIVCKLTGEIGPSVKAHIIPESFYELGSSSHEGAKVVRLGKNPSITKSPIGEYDQGIVTAKGEAYFSEGDEYANKVFIRKSIPATQLIHDGTEVHVVEIAGYDYRKLKVFFLSLLWRAAVSERPFFSNVSLSSEDETQLRRLILNRNPGTIDDFPVTVGIHQDTPAHGFPIVAPHIVTDDDTTIQHYKFDLGRFIACILPSKQQCPETWKGLALSPEYPLRILMLGPHRTSSFYQTMSVGVRELHKKLQSRKKSAPPRNL